MGVPRLRRLYLTVTRTADALRDAGVPVEHRNYEDASHGFVTMLAGPANLDAAHDAVADIGDDLRTALH